MHKPREYDAEACNLFLACIIKDTAWIPIFLDRVGEDDLPQSQGLVWKAIVTAYLDKAEPTVLEILHRLGNTSYGGRTALDVVGTEYVESLRPDEMLVAKGVRDTKKIRLFLERIEKSSEKALLQELKENAEKASDKRGLDFDTWWNNQTALVIEKRQKRQGVGAKQFGEYWTTFWVTSWIIFMLVNTKSSRLIPGFLGTPEVMTTMSEFAVSS